jgi:hypothetical protein
MTSKNPNWFGYSGFVGHIETMMVGRIETKRVSHNGTMMVGRTSIGHIEMKIFGYIRKKVGRIGIGHIGKKLGHIETMMVRIETKLASHIGTKRVGRIATSMGYIEMKIFGYIRKMVGRKETKLASHIETMMVGRTSIGHIEMKIFGYRETKLLGHIGTKPRHIDGHIETKLVDHKGKSLGHIETKRDHTKTGQCDPATALPPSRRCLPCCRLLLLLPARPPPLLLHARLPHRLLPARLLLRGPTS